MRNFALMLAIFSTLIGAVEAETQSVNRERVKALSRSAQVRYNRVEGLFMGYRLNVTRRTWKGFGLFAQAGYGLHNRSPRWEGGMDYKGRKSTLSLAFFDRTETEDREIIRTVENTLFALLFKGDYRDYFRAKNGFEARGTYRYRPKLLLTGRLMAFTYVEMPIETEWSLFRRNRDFRANPAVRPGGAGLLQIGFLLDTRVRSPLFRNACTLVGIYERGFREFGYNGLVLVAKRYQKVIFGSQAFVLQGRLATRESTAEQHLFDLGGVGTLRGFGIKEFTGNRVAMLNVDYLFRGDLLGRIPLRGAHLLSLILFFDTGWAFSAPRESHLFDGFQHLTLRDFKSDMGVALALPRQILRFNLARRLDRRSDPWTFSVRLMRKL